MSAFVAAESAANPAAIRAAAADLDRVAGMITGHGQAVTAALDAAPPTFSDLFAEQLRGRVRDNEAAWRSALSSVVYAAGVTRAWADDVEWFQAQQRALGAQVAAATAGTAGLTAPAITPGAPPETIANSLQQFSAAVDSRRAELNAQGAHASGALLNQLQERAAQRAADLRSGPTPVTLDRLDVAGVLPGAAASIFAGTGWTAARPIADLLALVTAGLLPGSALTMNWKDLITKVIGEWAHLLDRAYPTIPVGSPLAGAFIPAVSPLTGGVELRPIDAAVEQAFAGLDASLALLLGGLYPRQLASAGTAPPSVQAVAARGLQAGSSAAGPGSPMAMNGGLPDLAAMNTSLVGKLSQKLLASNDAFIDIWATGLVFSSNIRSALDGDDPGRQVAKDRSIRHNTARDKAAELLATVVRNGGDPTGVTMNFSITKELPVQFHDEEGNPTSDGRVDLAYQSGKNLWLWEVKGTWETKESYDYLSKQAAEEVALYVHAAKFNDDVIDQGLDVDAGFPLGEKTSFVFADFDWSGAMTPVNYTVEDGVDRGAILYHPEKLDHRSGNLLLRALLELFGLPKDGSFEDGLEDGLRFAWGNPDPSYPGVDQGFHTD